MKAHLCDVCAAVIKPKDPMVVISLEYWADADRRPGRQIETCWGCIRGNHSGVAALLGREATDTRLELQASQMESRGSVNLKP